MKKLHLLILFSCAFLFLNAKNYYVSSSAGSDAADGSVSSPWKSIAKINSIMATLTIGDSVLFKCGDTFTDSLNITKSGSSVRPIVFASYGVGAKPVINTAVTLSSWTATAANPLIWVADYTGTLPAIRYLTLNGKIQQVGRYPDVTAANDGFLYNDQAWNSNKFRDASLNSATRDWTGAECVVYAKPYSINVIKIKQHLKDTITLISNTAYGISGGYGYFIQNHLATLTRQGEWYFDPATRKIYLYSPVNPSAYKVQASGARTCVNFSSSISGIVIRDLSFEHANAYAISIPSGNYISIVNCDFRNSLNGIRCTTSSNITIDKNSFQDIFNVSVATTAMSSNFVVTNNRIKRNAIIPGLGNDGSSGGNNAISLYCANANISYNTIDSCSYIGIRFEGYGNKIHHNEISNFNMRQFDGAAIYSFGTWASVSGLGNVYGNNVVEYNYLHDGIGYRLGTNSGDGFNRQPGVYFDFLSERNTVRRNVLYNTNGILFNNGTHHHTAVENTLYNSDAFERLHPGIAGIGGAGLNSGSFQTITKNTLFNIGNYAEFNPYTGYNVGRSVDTVPPFTNHGHRNTQNIVFSSKYYSSLPMEVSYSVRNYQQYFNKLDSNYYWQPFALDSMITLLSDSGYTKSRKMVYGPVQWKKYEPNAVLKTGEVPFTYGTPGTNLFASNSTFDTDLTGWSFDSENTTNPCYWTNSGLDGGCVILSQANPVSATKPSSVRLYRSIGTVKEGDVYLLRFSMKSNSNIATLHINTTSGMSTPKMYKTSTTRTEYSVPICFSNDATSQYIYFTLHDKGKLVYLDNISLQKVSITQESPATAMRFEVNTTGVAKQVDLGNTYYKDVFGKVYTGTITIDPYSSRILLKTSAPSAIQPAKSDAGSSHITIFPVPNKASQPLTVAISGLSAAGAAMRVYSIGGALAYSSPVLLEEPKTIFPLPALPSGVYLLELVLDNGTTLHRRFIQ